MANFRGGYLEQGQPLGQNIGTVSLTSDSQSINPAGISVVKIYSDSAVAADRDFTIEDSSLVGQELTLVLYSGGGTTCRLIDVGNVILAGTWTPSQYDSLQLYWDGSDWVETSRTAASSEFNPNIVAPFGGDILVYDQDNGTWDNKPVTGAITMDEDGVTTLIETNFPLPDGQILVGDASDIAQPVDVTGAISIDNTGLTSFSAGAIVDADINASAAIQLSKLENLTAGNIVLGNGSNVATSTPVTGVIAIDSSGVTTFNTESNSATLVSSGTLTSSDILNLDTIPIQLLPAPASGFIYILNYITLTMSGTTAYTAGSDLEISANSVVFMTLGQNIFQQAAPSSFTSTFTAYDVSASNVDPDVYGVNVWDQLNQAVYISANGGAFLTGDLTADYEIAYQLQQIFG